MKILLTIDGSYHSDEALNEVVRLPWPTGTKCTVMTVAEPLHTTADALFGGLGHMALEAQQALDADIRKLLDETAAKLEEKFGKGNVTSAFKEGQAAQMILAEAKSSSPDLIVMGSHGTSGYNDQSFGSVVITVANHAPCSVRIVHYIPSSSMEKKIKAKQPLEESRYLIAISESTNSKNLIDLVSNYPWPEESQFQILAVVPEPKSVFHSRFFKDPKIDKAHQELYKQKKACMEKLVQSSAARLETNGKKGKVTYHVLEGNVRSLILQIAQDWDADMILIGAHDHDKSILEHYLGSVAQGVIANTECSVEVVRTRR